MKRITTIVIVTVMLLGILGMASLAADVTAKPGESASVSVTMEGNPGITYLKITVSYDANALTLKSASDAGLLKGYTAGDVSANPYTVVWSTTSNISDNGKILTLDFEVKNDANDGEYPISISIKEASDQEEKDVDVSVSADVICVKAPETTTEKPIDPTTTTKPTTTEKPTDPTTTTKPTTTEKPTDPTTTAKPTTTEKPTDPTTTPPSTKDNGGNGKETTTGKITEIPRTGDAGISTVVAVAVIAFGAATVAIVSKKKNDE